MHPVDESTWRTVAKRVAVAVGVVAVASVVVELTVVGIAVAVASQLSDAGVTVLAAGVTQTLFAVTAIGFLWYTDGWSMITVRYPSRRELLLAAIGTGGLFVLFGLHRLAVEFSLVGEAGTLALDSEIGVAATVGLVVAVVVVAPIAEELLFRGVIQQYLTAVSSAAVGIGVASVLFAGVHLGQVVVVSASASAAAAQLVVLAGLGAIVGVAYEKTGNLSVPIVMHAAYNAPQIAALLAML